MRKALAGQLEDQTEVLYVSPLKTLGNDIQTNLDQPLGEILQLAGQHGLLMPEIRTAVHTGDTLLHGRRAICASPSIMSHPCIISLTSRSCIISLTSRS